MFKADSCSIRKRPHLRRLRQGAGVQRAPAVRRTPFDAGRREYLPALSAPQCRVGRRHLVPRNRRHWLRLADPSRKADRRGRRRGLRDLTGGPSGNRSNVAAPKGGSSRSTSVIVSREMSKTERSADGVHPVVGRAFERRGRTRPQVCSDFDRLSRQHLNATHVSRIARMADSHDVDALCQLLRDPPRRVGCQRRDNRVLSREDFDCRIGNASARACGLHDRDQVPGVRRVDKVHQRERRAGNRRDPCQCADD